MRVLGLVAVLALFFSAGVAMFLCPVKFQRMIARGMYSEEYLNRFATRVMGRAMGLLFMMFCITAGSSSLVGVSPESRYRFGEAMLLLFGVIWISGLVLGLATWLSPRAKAWTQALSTDRITDRQHRLEIIVGASGLLSVVAWAVLPLVTR